MCRTCRLTRSCSGIVTIYTVLVTIVFRPHMRSPFYLWRQRLFWIFNSASVLLTQFLPKFNCTRRTIFNTSSTGNTIICCNTRHISWAWHVRRIKKLRCSKCITYIYIAVAYCKYFILTVNISYLMNKSILFSDPHYIQSFFSCNVTSALICLYNIICHIADCYTPAFRIICTTLVKSFSWTAAWTWTGCILSIIFIKPMWNMLNRYRPIFHFYCFLNRYYMHTDTCTSRRNHWCNFLKRKSAHPLKKSSHLRIFFQKLLIHICKFCTSWHKHWEYILFLSVSIFPVILYNTIDSHFL